MDWSQTFAGRPPELAAVAATALLAYAALVVVLRISGKRTLSRMNAFDLVVTVALGSTLGTTILSPSVSWLQGMVALATLVLLQALVAKLALRSTRFGRIIKSEPVLLAQEGRLVEPALRSERVAPHEVWAAARKSGVGRPEDVAAVWLESDGTFTVIGKRWDSATFPGASSLRP